MRVDFMLLEISWSNNYNCTPRGEKKRKILNRLSQSTIIINQCLHTKNTPHPLTQLNTQSHHRLSSYGQM